MTLDQDNGTNEVNLSETRRDPTYIFWWDKSLHSQTRNTNQVRQVRKRKVETLTRYTLSLLWHPTLTTGLLPFLALLYMNSQIFLTVRYVNCEVVFYKETFFSWYSCTPGGREPYSAEEKAVNALERWAWRWPFVLMLMMSQLIPFKENVGNKSPQKY